MQQRPYYQEGTMKAIRLELRGSGGVASRDIPAPVCASGQARVRLRAASVNRVDLYMRDSGAGVSHALPQTMGWTALTT
jgi:NADPH:quinone reductase-like Zn-dependent oxidoreductase